MTIDPKIAQRLQFLTRVIRKECEHLSTTDQRLFASAFSLKQAGHAFVPSLVAVANRMISEIERRGWA